MTKEAVQAKATTAKDGSYIMYMEGEKYPFPGFPRGHLLYGTLSKLKHEIKVQLFNANWWRLEKGESIVMDTREILKLAKNLKYDMIPISKSPPAVREIHRCLPQPWADIIGYIITEDDAYRFRFQFLAQYLDKRDPIGSFDRGMELLEHAELVEDMKERVRLFRRVLLELWKDPEYAKYWIRFVQNLDKKKVTLKESDKYFLRAKYFKADYKDPSTFWGRASNAVLY